MWWESKEHRKNSFHKVMKNSLLKTGKVTSKILQHYDDPEEITFQSEAIREG
jgi:hypothetical protein